MLALHLVDDVGEAGVNASSSSFSGFSEIRFIASMRRMTSLRIWPGKRRRTPAA
jgi:hypothetical protein